MSTLDEALKYKYMAMTFEEVQYPSPVYSHLIASNDGISWVDLKKYDFGWRDPSLMQVGDVYYIAVGNVIESTTDFDNFKMDITQTSDSSYAHWASELFKDDQNNIRMVSAVSLTPDDPTSFSLRYYNFDGQTGILDSSTHELKGDWEVGSPIDPNITYYDGIYHLFVSESDKRIHYYTASNLTDIFEPQVTNLLAIQDMSDEAPELLLMRDHALLYSDPWIAEASRFIHYSSASLSDLNNWAPLAPLTGLSFKARHMGVLVTGAEPAQRGISVMEQLDFNGKPAIMKTDWEAISGKPNVASKHELVDLRHITGGTYAHQLPTGTTFADIVADINNYSGEWVNTTYKISDAPDGSGQYCSISVHKATNLGGGYLIYVPYSTNDIWYTTLNGVINEWIRLNSNQVRSYSDSSLTLSNLVPTGGRTAEYMLLNCQISDGPHGSDNSIIATLTSKTIAGTTGAQILNIIPDNTMYVRTYLSSTFGAWKSVIS